MYKIVQTTCFTKVFDVTAFGFVGCILVIFHGNIHLEVSIVKGVTPNGRFTMENPSINGWFAGILNFRKSPYVCLSACLPAWLLVYSVEICQHTTYNVRHVYLLCIYASVPIYMHMYTQQDTSICTFDGVADQDQWNTWCFSTPSHLKAPIKHVRTMPMWPHLYLYSASFDKWLAQWSTFLQTLSSNRTSEPWSDMETSEIWYPLVNVYITMENCHLLWVNWDFINYFYGQFQ